MRIHQRSELMNNKFQKRITALCAALLVAVSALSVIPIGAIEPSDSVNYIIPSVSSPDNMEEAVVSPFPDVGEDDWFFDDVIRLTALKILDGYPDGSFHPEREITNAEFVKVLMVAMGAATDAEFDFLLFPEHWASVYISLAYKDGILTDDDIIAGFDPSAPITRAAMTKMMVLALGIDVVRIDDPFSDISDAYASTAYNEYLLRGYLMPDGTRIYNGEGNALRSEAASIIVRVLDYREEPYAYKKDAILANAAENKLNTESEIIDLFYVLSREFMSEFTFMSDIPFDTWKNYYRHANVIYLEYFYTTSLSCSYNANDPVEYHLTLRYANDVDELKALHKKALEKADKFAETVITEDMSDTEKVKAIHDYIILNCAYDYNNYLAGTVNFEARLAAGALCNKSAVCQGYAAAFNMLARRVGIRSVVVTGTAPGSADEHAWNMVLIGGRIYHIDVTHDDPVPDMTGRISYRYYMLSDAEMTELGYVWDKSQSNLKYFY